MCLGFDMVEVDSQRLKLERRGVGILLRISCGWLVFMLFFSPVAGLRPLRDRTNSWGDGGSAVQLYAKGCSKLLLHVLKSGPSKKDDEVVTSIGDEKEVEDFCVMEREFRIMMQ